MDTRIRFARARRVLVRDPETGGLVTESRLPNLNPARARRYGPRAKYYPVFRPTDERPRGRLVLRVGREERTYLDEGQGEDMNYFNEVVSAVKGALTWWVIIAPWERGLRVRLGKTVDVLEPGVSLRVPGIDKIYIQPIRLRTLDLGVQTVTTRDGHAATLAGNVQFKIDNIRRFYNSVHTPDSTVIDLAAAAIAQFITTHTKADCTPARVQDVANTTLDLKEFGLGEGRVNLTDFAFVRTFRLIQDDRAYREGSYINMGPEGP